MKQQFLIITNIPKDEAVLKKILKAIGETWNKEAIAAWMQSERTGIYYDAQYQCYVTPKTNRVPVTKLHSIKPYWNILKG